MPDKKPTDSEIKKALECCVGDNDGKNCFDCPLWEIDDCQEQLLLDTLDIINRLQAEIERLKADVRFSVYLGYETTNQIKAEAIKEFAKKVNDEITNAIISNGRAIEERETKHNVDRYEDNFCSMCDGKIIALGGIKLFMQDLLKEMVGDSNVD